MPLTGPAMLLAILLVPVLAVRFIVKSIVFPTVLRQEGFVQPCTHIGIFEKKEAALGVLRKGYRIADVSAGGRSLCLYTLFTSPRHIIISALLYPVI
ncbi:hypothetical protein XELAEV_18005554mg [Xenopus laevis]|uniref:Uncharacterized protein n=1 Tax=Xenopus laevis TaxID=8355 RepID=A0A974DXI4_XENLA|nr:hypothetical protein XELAEV_18005554mg [Xenopus laevis]